MTDRIYWPTGLTPGVGYVPVVLVAGIPWVLTPAGVHPTSTSFTTATPDPLYWPGNGALLQSLPGPAVFDPVKEWLDPNAEWATFENADYFKGETKEEELAFDLFDVDGAVTAELSQRDARVTALLGADVTAAAAAIPLVPGTAAFPATGIAGLARETIIYDGGPPGGGSLTIGGAPATRGAYGSRARTHVLGYTPPVVSAGGARYWQERQCTVWVARLSIDGLTLYDPTLVFLGAIGYGIQLTTGLTRWKVPVAPATEVLSRKFSPLTIDLSGFAHFRGTTLEPARPNPLLAAWGNGGTFVSLTGDATAGLPSGGGWHATWQDFALAWNAEALRVTGAPPSGVRLSGVNPVQVALDAIGAAATPCEVHAPWNSPTEWTGTASTTQFWRSSREAPQACFWLYGRVKIPDAQDFAKIPATYNWNGWTASATLTLVAKTDTGEELHSIITDRDAAAQTVNVLPVFPTIDDEADRWRKSLITTPTTARLGLQVTAVRWDGAVRVAALALDALYGSDLLDEAIDWDHLAQQVRLYSPEPNGLECYLGADDTLLGFLENQARLHGFVVVPRYGRLTIVRAGEFADTERSYRSHIGGSSYGADSDHVTGGEGKIRDLEVIDVDRGLASGITYIIDGVGTFRVTNLTYQSEFSDGKPLEIKVPAGTFRGLARSEMFRTLQERSWTVLGPISEPYRTVRVTLPMTFLHLQPGDLVRLTSTLVPSWSGTRGVDCVCQVLEVRKTLFGGAARAAVLLRLQAGALSGYAPAALVAAGGLNAGSPIVQLDTVSGWGASCFAPEADGEGVAVLDAGANWYSVTDAVVLRELDVAVPIAAEQFTVLGANPAAAQVTLSGNPSPAMAAAAAAQYKVLLSFDSYDIATAAQHAFAFIADSLYTLGAAPVLAPHRWAP